MDVLPDVVGVDPRVVFCGLACFESAGRREGWYASPGNVFWDHLHRSGMVEERLAPDDAERLPSLGLGLTDLVRHASTKPPSWDAEELVGKVEAWRPEWLVLTSKGVAQGLARSLGLPKPQLGLAPWDVAGASVFVLPGTSGANQRRDYDGRPDRLSWWRDLASLCAPS